MMMQAVQAVKEASRLPRYAVVIIFFLLVLGYSFFQARFLILGPMVSVSYPNDGATAPGEVITMTGIAKNAAWLSLNGRQIFTNEDGEWSEKVLVPRGLSTMSVRAKDRFGRETEERVRIYLN